jgi:hypothetical protein
MWSLFATAFSTNQFVYIQWNDTQFQFKMSLFLLRSYLVHVKHKLICRKSCCKHRSHKISLNIFLVKYQTKGRNHCYPGGGYPRCKGVVFPNTYIYIYKCQTINNVENKLFYVTCHQTLGLDSVVEGTVPVNVLYDFPVINVLFEF